MTEVHNSAKTAVKKSISPEEWQSRLSQISPNKTDLDALVMNYLVIEGYKDAAEKFSLESGMPPQVDLSTIADRMAIRHAVQGMPE